MRLTNLLLSIVCTLSHTLSTADDSSDRARLRTMARSYIDRVDSEVSRMLHLAKSDLTGPEVVAQSKRMNALADEGDPIGAFPFSPFHQCRSAGIDARALWQTMTGMIQTQTTKAARTKYTMTAKECRQQIAKKK